MSDDNYLENREASLLKAKDKDAAIQLNELISEISEEIYCAGWMDGIEFKLYNAMILDSFDKQIKSYINKLISLSTLAGGWWYWDKEKDQDLFCGWEKWREIRKRK